MSVNSKPTVEGITEKAGKKREDTNKAPPVPGKPIGAQDTSGADPKFPICRLIVLYEDQTIGLFKVPLRASQNILSRLAAEGGKEKVLIHINFQDMAHCPMAERALSIKKNQMLVHTLLHTHGSNKNKGFS